jgi:hypothetical protein
MDTAYSDRLKELMTLIIGEAPKPQILSKAKALKIELSISLKDIQEVIHLLDGMVNQYARDEAWVDGFWLPESSERELPRFSAPTLRGMREPARVSLAPNREHVLDIANKVASNGIVDTKDVIRQLRAEGDQHPDRALAIGTGNILVRHGWQKIAVGKYKKLGKGSR